MPLSKVNLVSLNFIFFSEIIGPTLQAVSRNNLLHNISVWGPEFEIYLELRIHSWVRGWASILRFQAIDGDDQTLGQRVPALFTRASQRNKIHVGTNIGDDGNFARDIGVSGLNKWINITIAQKKKIVTNDYDIECTCLPVSVLKRDMNERKNPLFGSEEEQCYQVDSNIAFKRKDMNGNMTNNHEKKQLRSDFLSGSMMDSMMSDWRVEETINSVLAGLKKMMII